MTPERLAEIKKRCGLAQFGYDAVTTQQYYKDVSELLAELDRLTEPNVSAPVITKTGPVDVSKMPDVGERAPTIP